MDNYAAPGHGGKAPRRVMRISLIYHADERIPRFKYCVMCRMLKSDNDVEWSHVYKMSITLT